MSRDLGLIRVWGGESLDRGAARRPVRVPDLPAQADRGLPAADRPPAQRVLRRVPGRVASPYGSARLPDSDDVLAKWMALKGDERRLISSANMHLPGRQVDPRQVQRDIWRLGRWERERLERHRRASSGSRRARRLGGMSAAGNGHFDLKHRSRALTEGRDRAAARAYLKGIGYDDEALAKPIIGVANTWIETMPCNFHLRALAEHVKDGIKAAGGTPMEFNTVAISDGITMGTSGMKTSLVSREVIADSIELVTLGHLFDAVICLCACDKTIPGTVMALARLDVPGVMLYGGSIPPGHYKGKDITIMDVFEAVGANAAGKITDQDLADIEAAASPGAGACGGQFTANTMAMAFEMMGISPIGPSLVPAQDATKSDVALRGRRARDGRAQARPEAERPDHPRVARERDPRGRGVRRLDQRRPAPARRRARDGRRRWTSTTSTGSPSPRPSLCDLKPGGRFVATDLHAAGGTAVLAQRLKELGLLHADAPTVTGKTIGQHADEADGAPTARRSSARSTTRSRRPAGSRSCAATSRPRAAWSSSPATSAATTAARRACSRARKRRWPPSRAARSTRATSS